MRIGMLTTGYPHAGDPVAGTFVRSMAKALVARGHTVTVLCAARSNDAPVEDRGITVRPVAYAPGGSASEVFYDAGAPDKLARGPSRAWAGALAFPPLLLAAVVRHLSKSEALVSHFLLPCGAVAGAIRGKRPHLAIAHGTDALWLARLPATAQRALVAGATTIQITHSAARDRLHPSLRDDPRVVVDPMGFDPAPTMDPVARGRLRDELGAHEDAVLVLAVGRLVKLKGVDVLLQAVARLRGAANLALVVAGNGPERAELTALARSLGINARFEGAVQPARRDALLRAADLFVAPSRPLPDGRTEGAPVAVMEALGAGLAVIASDVGGVREVAGDAAMLVPPGDPVRLSEAIASLAGSSVRRSELGAKAIWKALPHRWDEAAARLEARLAV